MSDLNLREQGDFSGFEEQKENLSPTAAAQRQQFIIRTKVNIACQRLRMEIRQLESRRHIEQKYIVLDRLLPQLERSNDRVLYYTRGEGLEAAIVNHAHFQEESEDVRASAMEILDKWADDNLSHEDSVSQVGSSRGAANSGAANRGAADMELATVVTTLQPRQQLPPPATVPITQHNG